MTADKDTKKPYEILEGKSRIQAQENANRYEFSNDRHHLLTIFSQELGKLIQSFYGGDLTAEYNDLYDLMAVCYNYWVYMEWERYGHVEYDDIYVFYVEEFAKPLQE